MTQRVWDRYMTEQDRAHSTVHEPRRVGFGDKPALLLIDLYRWVFGDRPEPLLEAVKTWPGSCGLAGWNALPHIQRLLRLARDAGLPVIHTTGLGDAGVASWAALGQARRFRDTSRDMTERRRRMYDIIDEVEPLPGEAVLRKASPSAFWGTPLVGHLNFLGIDTLITCGESTSGCVRASVVDGCTNRIRMIVVEECVFDRTEMSHAVNLFDMNQKYADVVPLAEVEAYLSSRVSKKTRKTTGEGTPRTARTTIAAKGV